MIRIRVKDEATPAIAELLHKTENLQPAVAEAAQQILQRVQRDFAAQRDPGGARWAGLRPATRARKRGGAILRETGALAGSIGIRSSGGNAVAIASTGVDYAIYHQTGTSRMPQRRFLGFAPEDGQKSKQFIARYLEL